ncbi:Peroxiredoxin [Lishizhenia tianjinensis]|uniref:Peroxiredoxin n=1 Tax=Lishizhenia tianjinensis TaxID=477690 RepID=A0A1I7BW47_9FLAO|nr:redoxin domain-containing protein [Lishizhenia tianjinensis]SFT91398.1 Peroxiredoxin [Lishizhenia tianjinensis]
MKIGEKLPNLKLKTHQETFIYTLSLIGESNLLFVVQGKEEGVEKLLLENFDALVNENIEVYIINQTSPQENLELQRSKGWPFTFISDTKKELLRALGAKKSLLNTKPATIFLLGMDGSLQKSWKNEEFDITELLAV